MDFNEASRRLGLTDDDFINGADKAELKAAFTLGLAVIEAELPETERDRALNYYKETSLRAVKTLEDEIGHIPYISAVYNLLIPPIFKPHETMLNLSFPEYIANGADSMAGFYELYFEERYGPAKRLAATFTEAEQNAVVAMATALAEGDGLGIMPALHVQEYRDLKKESYYMDVYAMGEEIDEDEFNIELDSELSEHARTDTENHQATLVNEMDKIVQSFQNVHPSLAARYEKSIERLRTHVKAVQTRNQKRTPGATM